MDNEKNIRRFERLMDQVNRDGKDSLMEYIKKSDFYTAPASTKYHLSCAGGLLQHSLNVYDCLELKARNNPIWTEILKDVPAESLIIVALLHDLCKTNFYTIEQRWRKDSNNRWEQYDVFSVKDKVPYGHGEKSAMMIDQFMRLEGYERFAIRWHMGHAEPKESYMYLNQAMEKYPLILAIYEADQEASSLLEDKDRNKGEFSISGTQNGNIDECGFQEAEPMAGGTV